MRYARLEESEIRTAHLSTALFVWSCDCVDGVFVVVALPARYGVHES